MPAAILISARRVSLCLEGGLPIVRIAGAGCRTVGHLILICLAACSTGCLTTRVGWREPAYRLPLTARTAVGDRNLLRAQIAYAAALEQEKDGSPDCVDLYFQAAALTQDGCWQCEPDAPSSQIHRQALARLISTGEQFGRLDARCGLSVVWCGQQRLIPITHHGFVWKAEEFDCLEPVGDYSTNAFRVSHRRCGCGVPLVVTSSCEHVRPFLTEDRVFAATALLRGGAGQDEHADLNSQCDVGDWTIELYDPLRVDTVRLDEKPVPLAKDLSAAVAYRLRGERRTFLDNFFTPQPSDVESRLFTLEPYQPGKVPVVLIHGLLSDPFTWAEMVNELHATKGFVDKFQIWLFEYPTGEPFLYSAASMRKQLAAAQQTLDPEQANPQFAEMVLVGHSMGGLISKLQVTSSGDTLWRSIANRPFEQTVMQPDVREKMGEAFFFEPSPLVARVVFIGTPHRGSADARRLIGRIASALVMESPETRQNHRQLVDANPGVFSPEFTRRVPTSVDLLEPQSDLLQALYRLAILECVQAHSILGNGRWSIGYGPSDGIVPVESARYPEAQSERYIQTTHARLNKHVETIDELHRILHEHIESVDRQDIEEVEQLTSSTLSASSR